MEFEQKYTEGNTQDNTFQVEEGLLEELAASTMSLEQAQQVAFIMEDNADVVPSGKTSFTFGGVVTLLGYDDVFYQVTYHKPKDGIPTYYQFEDIDVDAYLDHILNETILIQYNHEE
tara:strand:+ start:125 stop:475 length:351 start_codon:yes stop_codon:yes gene_type:complete